MVSDTFLLDIGVSACHQSLAFDRFPNNGHMALMAKPMKVMPIGMDMMREMSVSGMVRLVKHDEKLGPCPETAT